MSEHNMQPNETDQTMQTALEQGQQTEQSQENTDHSARSAHEARTQAAVRNLKWNVANAAGLSRRHRFGMRGSEWSPDPAGAGGTRCRECIRALALFAGLANFRPFPVGASA